MAKQATHFSSSSLSSSNTTTFGSPAVGDVGSVPEAEGVAIESIGGDGRVDGDEAGIRFEDCWEGLTS
jgi:hypothetical protein